MPDYMPIDSQILQRYILYFLFALVLLLVVKHLFYKIRIRIACSSVYKLSGEEFEDLLLNLYRADGYRVKKIGGKGDFGVDLLVTKNGVTTAVQAKRYNKNVSLSAVQEVYAGKTFYGADKAVVITNSRFTKGAKMLAEPCEVELIEGDVLEEMIARYKKSGSVF